MYKKYYLNHIYLYDLVAPSTFTFLCNSHHHPSPQLFTFLD